MKELFVETAAALLAGCIVMILHELPKVLMTYWMDIQKYHIKTFRLRKIIQVWNYIDGLGLLFCVVGKMGFSRPYLIRLRDKKGNEIVGFTGWFSLILQFFIYVVLLRFIFHMDSNFLIPYDSSEVMQFLALVTFYLALLSFGMFITNCFPMTTGDFALLIAGFRPDRFMEVIKADYLVKVAWTFVLLMQIIPEFGMKLIVLFLK